MCQEGGDWAVSAAWAAHRCYPVRFLQATHLGVSTDQRSDKDLEAWVPDSEERLILREEFTSRMHQRFLDGKDGGFDYRCLPFPAQHPGPKRVPAFPQRASLAVLECLRIVPHRRSWGQSLWKFQISEGRWLGSWPNRVPLRALAPSSISQGIN